MSTQRAPDGFPGCLLLWRDLLRPALAALRRELWGLMSDSAAMVCTERWAGGNWEPWQCEGCKCKEEHGGEPLCEPKEKEWK